MSKCAWQLTADWPPGAGARCLGTEVPLITRSERVQFRLRDGRAERRNHHLERKANLPVMPSRSCAHQIQPAEGAAAKSEYAE